MAQIVEAHAVQFRRLPEAFHGLCRSARGAPSAAPATMNGFSSIAGDVRQYGLGRGAEVQRLLAGLAVRKEKNAALKVELRPLGVQNFAKPRASRISSRIAATAYGSSLTRRFSTFRACFASASPRQPRGEPKGLAFAQHVAKSRQFFTGQEAFAVRFRR